MTEPEGILFFHTFTKYILTVWQQYATALPAFSSIFLWEMPGIQHLYYTGN